MPNGQPPLARLAVDGSREEGRNRGARDHLRVRGPGVQLGVVDGCIESIALGQLEVSATVECEGKQLKELSPRKFDVPGEHHFEHPIPISGTNRYAASTAVKAEVQVLPGV